MVLLLLRAVVHQQFARAERVGPGDLGADHAAYRGDLLDHLVVRQRGEAQAAVLLRDDHAEELVLLDEVPQRRRQVGVDVGDLPGVDLPAQILGRAVEEGLLLVGELRRRLRQQLVPVRVAREQLALEAHRTRLQRDALGLRQRRQDPAVELQQRRGDQRLADGGDQQRQGDQRRQRAGNHGGDRVGPQQPAADQQGGGDRRERKSERRVGNGWVSTCKYRGGPNN